MDNANANKEHEVVPAIINSDMQGVSETVTQFKALRVTDRIEITSLNKDSSDSDRSSTYHLENAESKTRLYHDLSALTYETVNPRGVAQSESNLYDNEGNTVNMGCVSDKEGATEPVTKSKQNDRVNRRYSSKNEGEEIPIGDAYREQKSQLFENPSDVCRPKTQTCIGGPISSSFSAGNHNESEISTAIHETTGDADCIIGLGDLNQRVSFPGKAVRLETQNVNESPENDLSEVSALGRETKSKDTGRGRAEEKKSHHQHKKESDVRRDEKKEHKFRGIDQKWSTNYDDAYEKAHEKYEYFWRKHTIYSQWHYSVFFDDTVKFTCAEQYMMYQKAILFGDCVMANKISKEKDPGKIKSLGRKVHGFTDEVWNAYCLQIVKQGNIAKFSQNKKLKETLFSTYPKILVEASPVDAIWGIGLVHDDERAWDEETWEGKNYLGYVLTEVRDELMEEAGIIGNENKKVYLPALLKKIEEEKKAKEKHNKEGMNINKKVTEFQEELTEANTEIPLDNNSLQDAKELSTPV